MHPSTGENSVHERDPAHAKSEGQGDIDGQVLDTNVPCSSGMQLLSPLSTLQVRRMHETNLPGPNWARLVDDWFVRELGGVEKFGTVAGMRVGSMECCGGRFV